MLSDTLVLRNYPNRWSVSTQHAEHREDQFFGVVDGLFIASPPGRDVLLYNLPLGLVINWKPNAFVIDELMQYDKTDLERGGTPYTAEKHRQWT